ncbi:MAG: hypothetical protein KJ592_00925 [Nanoarchaeota archaeon]|nr:hypothetical protein [Nanoarchaeota archaeon]
MRQYEIDNEVVFGMSYKKMTLGDLKKFEINPTVEMNVLRHFGKVDSEYLKTLVGEEYSYFNHKNKRVIKSVISLKDIKAALNTKGTKFFDNVKGIENPRKLLALIKRQLEKKIHDKNIGWVYRNGKKVARFSFEYKNFVGEEDLVLLSSLSEAEGARVKKVTRGRSAERLSTVNVIEGMEKNKTKIISVKIVEMKEFPFYSITSYPRGNGMDSGNNYGAKDKDEYSRRYWDDHVFLS